MIASSASPTRRTWVLLSLILLTATALRVWQLGAQSFWLDEIFSLECSFGHNYGHLALPRNTVIDPVIAYTDLRDAKPWWVLPRSLDHDLHPPLAYLMIRSWCGVFGYSEAGVRSLSVVASVTAIFIFFFVTQHLHGSAAALWACLLMAIAQPQIEFAQEAKHYALLTLWSLATTWAILRAESLGIKRRRLIIIFTLTLISLFTHYYAVEALGAMAVYIAVRTKGRDRVQLLATLGAALLTFAIVWGPVIVRQQHNLGHDADFLVEGQAGHFSRTLMRAALIPTRLLHEPPPGWQVTAAAGAVVICLLPWLLIRRRRDLFLWAMWLPAVILPTLLIDLLSGTWALFLMRYSLLAGPAVYAILGSVGNQLRMALLRHAIPALAALSCLLAIPDAYHTSKTDWRNFGGYLGSHIAPGDVVVFATKHEPIHEPTFYFLCASHYAGRLSNPVSLLNRTADTALLHQLRGYRRVWIVTDVSAPEQILPGATYVEGREFPLIGSIMRVTLADKVESSLGGTPERPDSAK